MTIEINLPNIGENELEVTEIMIKTGDKIDVNQALIIIEEDKLSMEIPSPYSGIITNIHVKVGDTVHTGSLIVSLDNDTICSTNGSTPYKNNHSVNNTEFQPQSKILKQNYTSYTHSEKSNHNKKNHNNNQSMTDVVHATPLIRQMAREFKINLTQIIGSGRKGRIIKEDIYHHLNTSLKHKNENVTLKKYTEKKIIDSSTHFSKFGKITIIDLNKIQKISGINVQKNWVTIPHVTQFDEIDVTDIENFRKKQNFKIKTKKTNYKITPLIFIMKAVSKALQEFPHFNSSLSKNGTQLILKKYINIGIAVDTPKGLLIPVIQNVNKKGIIDLSKELSEISQKARANNQLTPMDIQGSSFTISSLGNIGGTGFTPIINAPEVAILGISKSCIKPIWTGKKFIPRLILPVSLSYDHRVINGADGARFIILIKKIISDIRLLLM